MEAKQAKHREMVSNPIVGTAPGVQTSNYFTTESNNGYDPFRLGSSNLKTRVSNTFSSQVIPNSQFEHNAFIKNIPTDGSTNSKAQGVLTPSGAKVITYQVIKDKGNVSNVVFGMSGDNWNPQPQERSKLKRVVDQPKDHGQMALFGNNGVELRSDKYLHEKPQYQPNYQQLHSKQRAYEHLHGATPDVSQISRKGDELLSCKTSWHNHNLPAKKVNQHFNQYQNNADRKIKEQISTAFGQHEKPEFQSSPKKISKTLLSTNAGWANSDTEVKKANNHDHTLTGQINLKEKKYSQLQSSVFNTDNGATHRPATSACNMSLKRENQLVNNANDEKRKLNHLYSEINGVEMGVQKNNLRDNMKENQKARGGTDFCTNSDWKNAQGQLLRKGKGDYSEQVMKNDSSAMGACLPLTRYQNGSGVDTKAIGFTLRKHEQHGNDIHQVDNFQKQKPKIVKQLHLKSNMHRKDFYQSADVESNQQVYEFSVDNLPADTYDNDLAKMCKGAHIVKSQVDFDKIMGSCNGHGKILIRSSPTKIQNTQKQLIERGLKVQACERKDIGKKSNFADLNQVNWMHPHLQKQERRLQNNNLCKYLLQKNQIESHDLMKGQDFYHSDPQIFGGESGRHLNEWKKNLLNSRALKLKNKTEEQVALFNFECNSSGKLRQSLQSWETVRQSNSNFKNAYDQSARQNVRTTVRSIKISNKKS